MLVLCCRSISHTQQGRRQKTEGVWKNGQLWWLSSGEGGGVVTSADVMYVTHVSHRLPDPTVFFFLFFRCTTLLGRERLGPGYYIDCHAFIKNEYSLLTIIHYIPALSLRCSFPSLTKQCIARVKGSVSICPTVIRWSLFCTHNGLERWFMYMV